MGGIVRRGHVQGGGGNNSMITYIAEKFPSDPVSYLFECLFSAFLNACVLSFGVIMIRNEFPPLMFSHHYFRRTKSLFLIDWPIGAAVGYT